MILFNPKRKRPAPCRAARSGSHNPSRQSAPHLPLRPVPPDPPPYTLHPPERTSPPVVAHKSNTQSRQDANASRVAADSLPATRDGPKQWRPKLPDSLHHRISLCDLISSKLDAVITSIDGEVFSGDERELGA